MTIKTRFKTAVLLASVLLFLGIVCVSFGIWQNHAAVEKTVAMGNLVDDLHELRDIGRDYRQEPSDRAREQWQTLYEHVKTELTDTSEVPGNVREAADNLKSIFDEISAGNRNGLPDPLWQRSLNLMYSNLDIDSQRLHDWATTLRGNARKSFLTGSRFYNSGIVSVLILTTFITITAITRVGRRIMSSLDTLEQGADALAAENAGQQIAISGDDEFSRLSEAFNAMSRKLYANHQELRLQTVVLEEEIAERQRTQEALQENNVRLEEEVEERQAVQQSLEEQTVVLEEEIAERTRVQEEHDQLEVQLRQSQKMEAIGLLAGGVAHDFNNILSVIMGYGSLLQQKSGDEKTRESVSHILNAAERAAELTKGLLAFGRKQVFTLEQADIVQLVNNNVKFLKRVIGEDVELITLCHHTPMNMQIDRSQIQQVLMNLATNARDAMKAGGKLTIEVVPAEDSALPEMCCSVAGYALIRVSDTGEGMDGETRAHIFEPFYTTKEQGKGTGLGLSITHGIILQHKGFIDCTSTPGAGTTFSIYLPLSEPDHSASTKQQDAGPVLSGTETILLAEDDKMLMDITSSYLELVGYKVHRACNGREAVEVFKRHEKNIDLVILDAIMPEMTGKQAWESIRELRPDVKSCFFSGYAEDIVGGKPAVNFSVPFISKPVMPEMLLRKVREILDA